MLENNVATIVNQTHGPGVGSLPESGDKQQTYQPQSTNRPAHPDLEQDEHRQWEIVVDSNSAPSAVPASHISEISTIPLPQQIRKSSQQPLDIVARGIVNIESASALFNVYRDRLDHFVYSILGDHVSFQAVRQASPLLADAICAVGALHSNTENYTACRSAFMQQVSKQMFSRRHCADDVRGLIVGAFWLSDLSWALIGAGESIRMFYF